MSEKLKKTMLDISTNVIFIINNDDVILDYNKSAEKFFKKKNIKDKYLRDFFTSSEVGYLRSHAIISKKIGLPVGFVFNLFNRVYDCRIYPYDFGFVIYFDDITDLNKNSEAIKDCARKLDLAQKVSKIGYFEMNISDKTTFFSEELYKIFGLKKKKDNHFCENIITKQIHHSDLDKYTRKIKKLTKSHKNIEINLRFMKKDTSEIIYCRMRASIFCEKMCKIVGTIQDLTSLIEAKKNLNIAKKKAEKISKAKSYFIGQASHDLRQPIQAMRVFIHSLEKEKLTNKQDKIVENINASVENLTYLLDNLIDVSKLDYDVEKYTAHSFVLSDIVDKIVKEFKGIAKSNEVKFKVNNLDVMMYSNPFFIERIIRNLLSNAFKYTKNEVLLSISINDKNKVVISVLDNGEGIKKNEIKHIFNGIYQNKNQKYKQESMGLGLQIVKKMLDLLDGNIEVKSNIGQGSEFIVMIPIIKKA